MTGFYMYTVGYIQPNYNAFCFYQINQGNNVASLQRLHSVKNADRQQRGVRAVQTPRTPYYNVVISVFISNFI